MTGAPSNPANAHESVSDWFRNRRRADGMGNRIDRQRRLRQALIPNAARVSARRSVMSDAAFGAGGTLRTSKLSLFEMQKVTNIVPLPPTKVQRDRDCLKVPAHLLGAMLGRGGD